MERPRVVLITGASTGIGRAAAIEMRGRGWRVFATVRKSSDVVTLTKLGRGLIEPLIMDVTDPESVRAAIETVRERAGRLDGLVNNAGIAIGGPLEHYSDEDLRQTFEVNLFGLHRVTREALPMLRESRGRIVNISSVGGLVVFPFNGSYSASKYAVEALSDALRMEMRGVVKVILIEPGSIRTPIWQKARQADMTPYVGEHYPAEELERMVRLATRGGEQGLPPEEVARAIAGALELPWPLPRWIVAERPMWLLLLTRFLPSVLLDRLKLRLLGWRARR